MKKNKNVQSVNKAEQVGRKAMDPALAQPSDSVLLPEYPEIPLIEPVSSPVPSALLISTQHAERTALRKADILSKLKHFMLSKVDNCLSSRLGSLFDLSNVVQNEKHYPRLSEVLGTKNRALIASLLHYQHLLIKNNNSLFKLFDGTVYSTSGSSSDSLFDQMREAIDTFSLIFPKLGKVVDVSTGNIFLNQIHLDGAHLRIILWNIFTEISYSSSGKSTVCIDVSFVNDDRIRIHASEGNTARLIREQVVDFSKDQASAPAKSGDDEWALGIYLAKQVAEMAGGSMVDMDRESPDIGYSIELPCERRLGFEYKRDEKTNSLDGERTLAEPATVLYIEDNDLHANLVKSALTRIDGLNYIHAETAREGVELAQRFKPDLILSDMCLPDASGQEAMQILRANPLTKDSIFIALSASAMDTEISGALCHGFTHYVTKPFRIGYLMDLVCTELRNKCLKG